MMLKDRMIEYRAKERLNQADFAKKVGLSTQTVCSIENGHQDPSKITTAKIELVIGKERE